jgi:hypothetical protein
MTALQRVQVQIMENHGINWRIQNNRVIIEDVWTFQGKTFSSWELCPRTIEGMKAWLGY